MNTLTRHPTRFFSETEIVETLVNAGIPFKKVGQEIHADAANTGRFSCKISIKKGGIWLSSDGSTGTFSQLLRARKITPAKVSDAAPTARLDAEILQEQEESRKAARMIWSNAWAVRSATEFYDGPELNKMTARPKGVRRRALEAARDAALGYLRSSMLDERWLTESGVYRVAACEKQGENRKEYDLGARAILVSPMGNFLNPSGVQRLFLTPDGVKVGRKMRGQKVVTLIAPLHNAVPILAATGATLHGEGLETVLSVIQVSGFQGRVCWDAGVLKAAFLHNAKLAESATDEQKNALQTQFLLVDRDESGTGQNACANSIRAMINAGIAPEKLIYALPPSTVIGGAKGADWRDGLLELGSDRCRQALLDCINIPQALPEPAIPAQPIVFRKLRQGQMAVFAMPEKGSLEDAAELVKAAITDHVTTKSKQNVALAVDCGVGKSHFAAEITASDNARPSLTVTPTRALANDASYCVAPARSNDKFASGYCNIYPEIEPFSEKWRSIVVHKCRTCPHGMAAMDYINAQKDDDYQETRALGVDMCQYILATDTTRNTKQISATAQKMETDPTLVKYGKTRRRIILDDTCNLNEHKIILPHLISQWGQLTRIAIQYDQKAMVDNSEYIARERAERKLLPLLDKLAAFVAGHSGEQIQIDSRRWRTFYQRVHNTAIKYQDGTTAEAVRLDNEGKMVIPLRALLQVAVAIQRGTAWVAVGKLFTATPTQALEHIKRGGALVADATLSKAIQAIIPGAITARVNTPNLKIIQVFSGRHSKNAVNANADNGFGQAIEAQRLMIRVKEIVASGVAPGKICILSHMDLIKPLLEDGAARMLGIPPENLGWFGNHNRGQNNWKECEYLLQWGVPRLGGANAARQYSADRQAIIEAGGQACHAWSGDWCPRSKQVPGNDLWSIGEGYSEPDVDAWDQSWVTGETVQGIGRLRAARRPDETLTVEIHSDFQFSSDHGFQIDEVQERTWTQTKNDLRISWLTRIYKFLAEENGGIGRDGFNRYLEKLGECQVNQRLFAKLAEISTGTYKNYIDECTDSGKFHVDDSIALIQNSADMASPPDAWLEAVGNAPIFDPAEYDFEGGGMTGMTWRLREVEEVDHEKVRCW